MYLANFERDDRLFDAYVNLLIFKQTCHICCFNDSFDFQTFDKDGYIPPLVNSIFDSLCADIVAQINPFRPNSLLLSYQDKLQKWKLKREMRRDERGLGNYFCCTQSPCDYTVWVTEDAVWVTSSRYRYYSS